MGIFSAFSLPSHGRLDTYDKFKDSFVTIFNNLKKSEKIVIAGGELGFACTTEIVIAMNAALDRGALVDVFAGPYVLDSHTTSTGVIENVIVRMFKERRYYRDGVRFFIAENYSKSVDFHFILYGKYLTNIQVEYPHHPVDDDENRVGFWMKNSFEISDWLKKYLNHGLKSGNYMEITVESDFSTRVKTEADFRTIQESSDYIEADKKRIALLYHKDMENKKDFNLLPVSCR